MAAVTVSPKGQIVIPSDIRERYGLTPGMKVEVLDFGKHLVLVPIPEDPVRYAKGSVKFRLPLVELLSRRR